MFSPWLQDGRWTVPDSSPAMVYYAMSLIPLYPPPKAGRIMERLAKVIVEVLLEDSADHIACIYM